MNISASSCTAIVVVTVPTVQIVPKASSNKLLCKFADDSNDLPNIKKKKMTKSRHKRGNKRESGDSQSLLPPSFEARRKSSSSAVIRKLGIGRGRAFKTKSIGDIVRKTWTRTVEGASRVFMEKHYNRHKRLINDATPTV